MILAAIGSGRRRAASGGIRTPYELTGARTSLAQESDYWAALSAAHPAVQIETIGTSVLGQPLRSVSIGDGDSTILVVALIHPDEWYPREALMATIRDLAVNAEGEWSDWLANHRLIALPASNPDGFPHSDTNANGLNLNRDYLKLSQPETRAVAAVMTQHRPDAVIDMHGFWGGNQFEPYSMGMTAPTPDMRTLAQGLGTSLVNALVAEGVNAVNKGSGTLSTLRALGMFTHSLGFTTELLHALPPETQIPVQISATAHALRWYADNAPAIQAAGSSSRSASASGVRSEPRLWTAGLSSTTLPGLMGYQLAEPLPQPIVDLHNIDVVDGFVSILQEAREVIPVLMDPDSAEKVVEGTRIMAP